jgi:hypothetical protein
MTQEITPATRLAWAVHSPHRSRTQNRCATIAAYYRYCVVNTLLSEGRANYAAKQKSNARCARFALANNTAKRSDLATSFHFAVSFALMELAAELIGGL